MCSVSLLQRVVLFSSLKLNCQLHPFSIHQNKNQGLWSVNWWIWGIPLGGLFRLWIFEVSRFSRVFLWLPGPSWFRCRPLPHKKPPYWEWQWWFRTICKSLAFFFFSSVWYGTCQITKTLTLTGHEKKHSESGCCWVWCSASSRLQLIHGGKAIAPKLFQPQLGSKAFESGFAVSTKSWYLGTSSFWVSFHSLRLGFHVVAAGSRRRLHSYPNKMYTTEGKAHTPLSVAVDQGVFFWVLGWYGEVNDQ